MPSTAATIAASAAAAKVMRVFISLAFRDGGLSHPSVSFACFVAALDDTGLPADEEFRAAMAAYMRWAVDRVVVFAPFGSVVPQREQVPRWGWDGLAG